MNRFLMDCKNIIVDYLEDREMCCDWTDIRVIQSCEILNEKVAIMKSPFKKDNSIYYCRYSNTTHKIQIDIYDKFETLEWD